jgi:hypothetical protein
MADLQEVLDHIKAHPDEHRHSYAELLVCCSQTENGKVVLYNTLLEAHKGLLGANGGVLCDVVEGACSCGAWHGI